MLPVLILFCLVSVGRSQFFPFLGNTGGPNVIGFQPGPGFSFGNGFQGINGPFVPNFVDNNFGPAVMPNFIGGNIGPVVMSNFVDNNIGPAVTPNFVSGDVGPIMPSNFVSGDVGPIMPPNFVNGDVGPIMPPNFVNNIGPSMMPPVDAGIGSANIADANIGPVAIQNVNDPTFGPAVMPNVNAGDFGPAVMPNVNAGDFGPPVMQNINNANIGPADMRNLNMNNANIGQGVMQNVNNNAFIRADMMPNGNNANIGPVGMANVNVGNIGQAGMQNVNDGNIGPVMNRNINNANMGPGMIPNLPRQNVLQTAATSNQQRGLAQILPFPQVIPQIPDLPRVSVPNPGQQTNNMAFDDFGRQISNQQQIRQNTNTANLGGAAFANFAQRPLGNRLIPISSDGQPAQTLDDVNRRQVPMMPVRNFPTTNQGVSRNTPADSVEGRFNAGLDFNDPRIRTPSAAAAAAAAAATSANGQRVNNNGLGQNLVTQTNDFTGGIGQNMQFDQNLALGPGFQGGVNFEPGFRFPGNDFQLNQPGSFPFNARPLGFNDDGFQTFIPGTQFSDFNNIGFGGPPQGGFPSPVPFDTNMFPGLSFPDQSGTGFVGGNNLIVNDFGFNNFPTGAGIIRTMGGNEVTFPGGPVMTL